MSESDKTEPAEEDIPPWRLSNHAREQAVERNIPLDLIEQIITNPQQYSRDASGRMILQGSVDLRGKQMLLRLVVAFVEVKGRTITEIITVYVTRLGRYGS